MQKNTIWQMYCDKWILINALIQIQYDTFNVSINMWKKQYVFWQIYTIDLTFNQTFNLNFFYKHQYISAQPQTDA